MAQGRPTPSWCGVPTASHPGQEILLFESLFPGFFILFLFYFYIFSDNPRKKRGALLQSRKGNPPHAINPDFPPVYQQEESNHQLEEIFCWGKRPAVFF